MSVDATGFRALQIFPLAGCSATSCIALECQKRGHQIRVYTLTGEGDIPPGFEVLVAPVKAIFNHRRNEKLSAWPDRDSSAVSGYDGAREVAENPLVWS